jgi:hypothetical protein
MTATRFCRLLFLIFVLVLCSVGAAYGQYGASIQGTVADKSGAVVPNATVTVTNQATGVAATTKSTDAGFYRIAALPPGRYTVKVEATSFATSTAKDVEVTAETVRGLNVTISPGGAKETVTVNAEAIGIQTENANVDGGLTATQINRLPTYGRDPFELLRLAPNVFGDGARDGSGAPTGSRTHPDQARETLLEFSTRKTTFRQRPMDSGRAPTTSPLMEPA